MKIKGRLKSINRGYLKDIVRTLLKIFLLALALSMLVELFKQVYLVGLRVGYDQGQTETEIGYHGLFEELAYLKGQIEKKPAVITKEIVITGTPQKTGNSSNYVRSVNWGGPELWNAVNNRRQENGVNPLNQADELCTIASIRLNELLELGKLDGHEGFSNLADRRDDLDWIFEKYSNVAEFLAVGAATPEETVNMWSNTLAHKKLLTGGEYVWGCIYAQNSFAVAISAY